MRWFCLEQMYSEIVVLLKKGMGGGEHALLLCCQGCFNIISNVRARISSKKGLAE